MLKQNPFFAAWDPTILDVYVETGLYLDENGRFKLKMSRESVCSWILPRASLLLKHVQQEAMIFMEVRACFEVWDLFPTLDERIELKFVMPGQPAPP